MYQFEHPELLEGVSQKPCRETYKASRHNFLNTLIMNAIKKLNSVEGGLVLIWPTGITF